MLRARVISDGDRSRLEGRLGWHPFVRVFSAVWLGLACTFFMIGAVGAAVHLAEGRVRETLPFLLFAGITGLFAGFFVAMTIFAGRSARPDVDYLRSWLTRHTEPDGCN